MEGAGNNFNRLEVRWSVTFTFSLADGDGLNMDTEIVLKDFGYGVLKGLVLFFEGLAGGFLVCVFRRIGSGFFRLGLNVFRRIGWWFSGLCFSKDWRWFFQDQISRIKLDRCLI